MMNYLLFIFLVCTGVQAGVCEPEAMGLDTLEQRKRKNPDLLWYQTIPTTGLLSKKAPYPYLPHLFSLWEWAPRKGAGVRIGVIDTGVAAFAIKGHQEYRKNCNLCMPPGMQMHALTVTSDTGPGPVKQYVSHVAKYVDAVRVPVTEIERCMPDLIRTCMLVGDERVFSRAFARWAKPVYLRGSRLNAKGRAVVHELMDGPLGMRHVFEVVELDTGERVISQFLPVPKISSKRSTITAGHGSHVYGLIAGADRGVGVSGLAPCADVVMIKAFRDDGTSSKSILIAGLQKALAMDCVIVNLSLKIADRLHMADPATHELEQLLAQVSYLVVASGNGVSDQLSYPARLCAGACEVGAFGYEDGRYTISRSQYERGVGPKFVMPGRNIIGCGLMPDQQEDSVYVSLDGTSMAAPQITAFLALALAEFGDCFTQQQIQTVMYASGFKMHQNDEWDAKSIFGVLDMRTALCILQVLVLIRPELERRGIYAAFEHLVGVTREVLLDFVHEYARTYIDGVLMEKDCASFLRQATRLYAPLPVQFACLHEAVTYVGDLVLGRIGSGYLEEHDSLFGAVPTHARRRLFKLPVEKVV